MVDNVTILLLSSPEGNVLLKCCLVRLARAFYITRQDQWKTIPEEEDKQYAWYITSHIGDKRNDLGKFVGVYVAKPRHIDSKR